MLVDARCVTTAGTTTSTSSAGCAAAAAATVNADVVPAGRVAAYNPTGAVGVPSKTP
jgi:hypothetical protein